MSLLSHLFFRFRTAEAEDPVVAAATLHFTDLIERYQAPRTVVLVHCRGLALPESPGKRFEEAAKWLN